MVQQACNPSAWEAEVGAWRVRDNDGLQDKTLVFVICLFVLRSEVEGLRKLKRIKQNPFWISETLWQETHEVHSGPKRVILKMPSRSQLESHLLSHAVSAQ